MMSDLVLGVGRLNGSVAVLSVLLVDFLFAVSFYPFPFRFRLVTDMKDGLLVRRVASRCICYQSWLHADVGRLLK